MPSFTDSKDRSWSLSLDVTTIRRVRSATGIDLARVFTSAETRDQLFGNLEQLVDVMWIIVEPAAKHAGITSEDFGSALGGDSLGAAIAAFEEAIVEFLPESRSRAVARQIVNAGRELQAKSTAMIAQEIDAGLISTLIDDEIAKRRAALRPPANSAAASTN